MEKTKLNKTLIYNKDSNIDTEIMDKQGAAKHIQWQELKIN